MKRRIKNLNTNAVLIGIVILFTIYIVDYNNNKAKGKRFTFEDGIVLYELLDNEDIDIDITKIYGDKQTDFREYIENKK